MKKIVFIISFLTLICSQFTVAQAEQWLTHFERSGGLETPRYDETIQYCRNLAKHSPWVHMTSFGTSPQGRALPLVIVSKNQDFRPGKTGSDKTVIMVQACIHPGESEGKDAGMMLIRDIAITREKEHLLDNITLLFIPIFNVDGHERFGQYNRINQNGPEEMGWRANARNLNLNRDYLKADSPEMQAWLRLFNTWDPHLFIDCHTSDGADYQYVMTYALETFGNMEKDLTDWQKEVYLPHLEKEMQAEGYPIHVYVSFRNWFDPESGIRSGASPPMISQGYTAIRNRPGLLLETHMLKPYQPRVESTYKMIEHTLALLTTEGPKLRKLIKEADEYTASTAFRQKAFPIDWGIDYSDSSWISFEGIAYEKVKSDLTGGDWYKYNGGPASLKLKMFNTPLVMKEVMLPEAYVIPVEWKEVIERLANHNIQMFELPEDMVIPGNTYRFSNYDWNDRPYEGRFRLRCDAKLIDIKRVYPAGSAVIPMDQALAKVAAWALEPEADGSFLEWGFFNTIFEQKEYGEPYVMEKLAREMIAEDPSLLKEFEKQKAESEAFANSQWLQLNWFYSKTPYWDEHKDVYPVGRIMEADVLNNIRKKL